MGWVDLITFIRLPLAVAFPLVDDWRWRLAFIAVAAVSDWIDGILARRVGPSRIGYVLDPIADKAFVITAFATLQASHALTWWEFVAVLSRDIFTVAGFLFTIVMKRPTTLPARAGGKWVTFGQFLTLLAFVMGWQVLRPMAWATAAISVYAIADYWTHLRRKLKASDQREPGDGLN